MLDIEKVTMTVSQCCNEGKGSRNYLQLMKIWPPCRCGRENNIDHTNCILGFVCHFSTGVHDVQTLPKKRPTWQMSLANKPLTPNFHGGRVLWCLCFSLCLDCICKIQKTFTLKQGFEGQLLWRWKYDLATSLEWDVCYVTILLNTGSYIMEKVFI